MQSGRELDKLICERIFKRKVFLHKSPTNREDYFMEIEGGIAPVPTYSTHIKNAWDVVEEVGSSKYLRWDDSACLWIASFDPKRRLEEDCRYAASADTAPHAICLAALKAVEKT